jgi:lipopolysaccharide export system protein LptA
MKRLTAGLLLAATVLLAAPAVAQLAPGGGPIDISANELELVDAQHLAIWRGDVDALQGRNRLRADVLNVFFTGKPTSGAAETSNAASPGRNWGKVDHMVAEGHVFYVSPTQSARGDHAVYELASDTVTVTGDVIVVQGQSVIHGEKLVIDVKTGHATMAASPTAAPERVRGIFFPNQSNSTTSKQP